MFVFLQSRQEEGNDELFSRNEGLFSKKRRGGETRREGIKVVR
jgi:hypothetical protein